VGNLNKQHLGGMDLKGFAWSSLSIWQNGKNQKIKVALGFRKMRMMVRVKEMAFIEGRQHA
jgi:hypothetical protein